MADIFPQIVDDFFEIRVFFWSNNLVFFKKIPIEGEVNKDIYLFGES